MDDYWIGFELVLAKELIDSHSPATCEDERESGGGIEESLFLIGKSVPSVYSEGGNQHGCENEKCGDSSQETGSEEKAPDEFGESRCPRKYYGSRESEIFDTVNKSAGNGKFSDAMSKGQGEPGEDAESEKSEFGSSRSGSRATKGKLF